MVANKEQSYIDIYKKMCLIRQFEHKVSELFLRGLIPGTIHLSFGEEGVAVGVSTALREDDFIIPTHRGHGYALAKGMETWKLFAELLAREDGVCKGKGGSLHIGDMQKGIFPGNPIVGSSIPLAVGIAFSFFYRNQDRVVVSYFGDGAVNTGPFHEGLNLAAIWNLPVLFVCTNNQYAISTPAKSITRLERLVDRAVGYGIPGLFVDGNDVLAVYETATKAIKQIRAGGGPIFIECLTYRQGGHKRDDPAPYRSKEEVEEWLKKDPILRFREVISKNFNLDHSRIEKLDKEVEKEIESAVEAALRSPAPPDSFAFTDIYA